VGDVVSASGEGIGPANVDELYLTNAGLDEVFNPKLRSL